jgi:hypothetical protein
MALRTVMREISRSAAELAFGRQGVLRLEQLVLDGGAQGALQALVQGQVTGLIQVLSDVYQWCRWIAVHNDGDVLSVVVRR